MKILLIGEYSNVHATLADGLRHLGHHVTVISNGDFWKNYPRDISLIRPQGKFGGIFLMLKLLLILPRLKGYDVVQIINPMFIELKAERILPIYKYLRKHNKKVFLCGFGMDWYWVHTCIQEKPLRYSDFNIGEKLRTNKDAIKEQKEWIGTYKEYLNKYIAYDCDGIITGLYEYWICYIKSFPNKTTYIPFPINTMKTATKFHNKGRKLKIFIGINVARNEYKGTDIMLKAAKEILKKYPDKIDLTIAESVPYAQYEKMLNNCDVILDQLYSYTPSMNSLLAMSKGIICIGGGEAENYNIINENKLHPIINVQPNYISVYNALESLIKYDSDKIQLLKEQSIEYVNKHHNYIKVAKQYVNYYNNISSV